MTHINSREAYESTQTLRARRREDVLRVFQLAENPLTDRAVMHKLGYDDMNMVRPRITELIKSKRLRQVDKIPDFKTGRSVRAVELRTGQLQFVLGA